MRFIFLKSGDYLEFQPNKTKFVKDFFEHLVKYNLINNYEGDSSDYIMNTTEERLQTVNQYITGVNNFIKILIPNIDIQFNHNDSLNQVWLNDTHKKWAYLTHTYKDNIYNVPDEFKIMWSGVNELVHQLESFYSHKFKNTVAKSIPESFGIEVGQEDQIFSISGLCLAYGNLGRHQYNQWEVGTDIDYETNNYKVITTNLVYKFSLTDDVAQCPKTSPKAYSEWCNVRNIPALGPWVSLGEFVLPRFTVKEIMHRNLKKDVSIGFEL